MYFAISIAWNWEIVEVRKYSIWSPRGCRNVIETNTFCNLDNYIFHFGKIHFAIWKTKLCNLDKKNCAIAKKIILKFALREIEKQFRVGIYSIWSPCSCRIAQIPFDQVWSTGEKVSAHSSHYPSSLHKVASLKHCQSTIPLFEDNEHLCRIWSLMYFHGWYRLPE